MATAPPASVDCEESPQRCHGSFPWLVCRTHPRHEHRAQAALTAQGAEAWVPTHWATREWSDRRRRLEVPLLPGYCFVRWAPPQWGTLLTIGGVRTVLRTIQLPSVVPEDDITNLRRFTDALAGGGLSAEPATLGAWHAGDPVRVERGPFGGVHGRVVRRRGGLRLVLALDTLGEGVMVTVPATDVRSPGPAIDAA